MGVFVSKVVEEHNYRTEWVELDEVNKNKVNKNQTTSRH